MGERDESGTEVGLHLHRVGHQADGLPAFWADYQHLQRGGDEVRRDSALRRENDRYGQDGSGLSCRAKGKVHLNRPAKVQSRLLDLHPLPPFWMQVSFSKVFWL